jgi:hypothetical protein
VKANSNQTLVRFALKENADYLEELKCDEHSNDETAEKGCFSLCVMREQARFLLLLQKKTAEGYLSE